MASIWVTADWGFLPGKGERHGEARKQVDYVVASKYSRFNAPTHNGEKLHAWDHCLVRVTFNGEGHKVRVKRGRKAWAAGWRLKDAADIKHFRREVAPISADLDVVMGVVKSIGV